MLNVLLILQKHPVHVIQSLWPFDFKQNTSEEIQDFITAELRNRGSCFGILKLEGNFNEKAAVINVGGVFSTGSRL